MAVTADPVTRTRSLLPQEHGAWGQLAMPLLSALLIAGATPAALLLLAATVLGFLAHEPWLVLLGHRGVRATTLDGPRARRTMRLLLLGAAATGGAGAWLAPWPARWALLVPALLATVVVSLVLAKQERTVAGELTVVTALATSGLAVAMASGAPLRLAASATATWVLAFASSVFAVQVVLARAQTGEATELGRRHAAIVVAVALGGSALAALAGLGWIVGAAVAPTALLSVLVCLLPFGPRQLRTLGWGLVASTTVTLLVLVLGLRTGL